MHPVGLGAVAVPEVYAIILPLNYENYSILHLEMLNILVAVRTWGVAWSGKQV